MLEHVVRKLRHRKLVRRLSEVDRPIRRDVEIVESSKLDAVRFDREYLHPAGFVH